jgi:adenine-specific DNA-methyltransferase
MNAGKSERIPQSCLVYTPPELARAMVRALKIQPSDRVLEPCIGQGALLKALAESGVEKTKLLGLDLEQKSEALDLKATVQRGVDFLHWSQRTNDRFAKIIANPPYVAIERLRPRLREAACSVKPFRELDVKASANTWYAFFIASLTLLKVGGSLCFVLPAAWDYANYAKRLRSEVGNFFCSVEVHRCQTSLFKVSGILDGCVVVIARRLRKGPTKQSNTKAVARFEYRSMEAMVSGLERKSKRREMLRPSVKSCSNGTKGRKLSDYMSIGIGAVTGDASYFLLSESERIERGLPAASLRPVISRARHLTSPIIDMQVWSELKRSDDRIWLFDPIPSSLDHPAVKKYIGWGTRQGCDIDNHKIQVRHPWYRVRVPRIVDAYLSGMSSIGPLICFRNMERLTATNTLYVVEFCKHQGADDRAALALGMLTSKSQEMLSAAARNYAAGLSKFEPSDLLNIEVPTVSDTSGAWFTYQQVAKLVLQGHRENARQDADRWFFTRA